MNTIPFNKVGNAKPETIADVAESEGISEEEWRAQNLPASMLEFRWRYTNKTIHLYERRLRSLAAIQCGPCGPGMGAFALGVGARQQAL